MATRNVSAGATPEGGLPFRDGDPAVLQPTPVYRRLLRSLAYALGGLHPISPKNAMEGAAICREFDGHGIASTLCKFSKAGDDPVELAREFSMTSNFLRNVSPENQFYLSIKPPTLRFDLEHAAAIASVAQANGHGIHFDSHGHELAEATIDLLERLMEKVVMAGDGPRRWNYGLTIPSRWKRSIADARRVAERGVRIRLVKGEFRADRSSGETDPSLGFLTLVDQLAGTVPEIAIATHDRRLAREAVARCKRSHTSVQLELLFGIPAPDMIALSREMAVPLRFHVPYGDTLLVYGIRHFLTHPRKLLRPDSSRLPSSSRSKLDAILESLAATTQHEVIAGV